MVVIWLSPPCLLKNCNCHEVTDTLIEKLQYSAETGRHELLATLQFLNYSKFFQPLQVHAIEIDMVFSWTCWETLVVLLRLN